MSIIFVGSTVDRETLKSIPDSSVAGNKMELGFVKGFVENSEKVIAVSVVPHKMWWFNGKPLFIKNSVLYDEKAKIITVSYINLPVLKQLSIIWSLRRTLRTVLDTQDFCDSTLMVYNTMTIFANPVISLSKSRRLRSIAVVADLPIQSKKSLIRRVEDKRQIKYISKFDGLIPLTANISKDFAPGVPSYLVEAGCNPTDYSESITKTTNKTKRVVFSGTLNELSGVFSLIEAMDLMDDPDIELNIYGDGPYKEDVIKLAEQRKNVKYLGRVTNEEMISIQRECDLLVCPRKKDDFTTKYTFPSKLLEYICAGVPVLANRLPGIPDEYEDYINFTEDESKESWAESIILILKKSPEFYLNKASNAKSICLEEKSWYNICNRVLRFINELGENNAFENA